MISNGQLSNIASVLGIIANARGRLIVEVILQGESSVGSISARSGLDQSSTSQYLTKLKRANFVQIRRAAQMRYYSFAEREAGFVRRLLEIADAHQSFSKKTHLKGVAVQSR